MLRKIELIADNFFARLLSSFLRLLPMKTRRVRCLLVRGDEVLLVMNRLSHKGQRWSLPGGGMKTGESVTDAALREVEEELAITLTPEMVAHMGTVEYAHGRLTEQLEVVVAAVPTKEFRRQKLELLDVRWFLREKLPQNIHPVVDEAIKALNSKS